MKHAATTTATLLRPAYYLTPDTKDYPLVLLVEGCGPSPDDDLPVAHGVRIASWTDATVCPECGEGPVAFLVETTESGGGNPAFDLSLCATCTVAGDHAGLLPSHMVEFVPYE